MKKISEGYYYNVYDAGKGKVVKKQKTTLEIFIHILIVNKLNIIHTLNETRSTVASIKTIRETYEKIFNTGIDLRLLGNPRLLHGINYEQDTVTIVKSILNEETDFNTIVTDFTDLIKKFWAFGIHEQVFNFSINNGYNADKEIVLIDFNEITFNFNDALKDVLEQTWLYKWSYFELSKENKSIYKNIMQREITEENLKKYWISLKVEVSP